MKELKDWHTPFTEMLDKYLLYTSDWYKTYFWGTVDGVEIDEFNRVVFRAPGATRGHVKIDDNFIIQDVVFYDDVCFNKIKCFSKKVLKAVQKYKGTKLELPKYYKGG